MTELPESSPKIPGNPWRKAVIWVGVALLVLALFRFFHWSIVGVLGVFLAPVAWLPVLGLLAGAGIAAIALPIRCWSQRGAISLVPLGILAAGTWGILSIDFTGLWLAANFRWHREDRVEVVEKVKRGELAEVDGGARMMIALPDELDQVSISGGQVLVSRDSAAPKIFFYTFRGVTDNFAGFVYSVDGSAPENGEFGGQFFVNRKVEGHWFYVSAH